ncbi:FHA domain-containing protein [bacterium]|nr:FHA domain-containing protein [bacterium]
MSTLTLKFKEELLGDYQLQDKFSLTIGRGEKNDVVIQDPAISKHHAKIDPVGDRFVLIDLQSKNGTFVNENLAVSHWLKHGDVISIGNHQLVYNQYGTQQIFDDDMEDIDNTVIMDTSRYRDMMIKSNPTKSINVVRFWDKAQDQNGRRDGQPKASTPSRASDDDQPTGVITYLAGGLGKVKLKRKIATIGKHPSSDVVVKGFLVGQTAVTITQKPEGFYLTPISGLAKLKVDGNTVKVPTLIDDLSIIEIGSAKLQFSLENSKD